MGREKDYIIVNKQHPPSGGYLSGFTSEYKKSTPYWDALQYRYSVEYFTLRVHRISEF